MVLRFWVVGDSVGCYDVVRVCVDCCKILAGGDKWCSWLRMASDIAKLFRVVQGSVIWYETV